VEKLFVKFGKFMSRIGLTPIIIPASVTVTQKDRVVEVKGPKGTLSKHVPALITVTIEDGKATLARKENTKFAKSLHGTCQRLINNMVIGVTDGFKKNLELIGTGYRVVKQGPKLVFSLGFSHPVEYAYPSAVTVNLEGNTKVLLESADKELLGQVAATIRNFRPPEPYKGKGIRYEGEVVRRKAGKTAKAAG
jgi:large subunit ribosomal protein L6